MDPSNLTWFNWPAVLVVLALVQVVKDVGFPQRWAAVLGIVIGVTFGILAELLKANPIAIAGINGLVAALVASGVWSLAKGKLQGGKS